MCARYKYDCSDNTDTNFPTKPRSVRLVKMLLKGSALALLVCTPPFHFFPYPPSLPAAKCTPFNPVSESETRKHWELPPCPDKSPTVKRLLVHFELQVLKIHLQINHLLQLDNSDKVLNFKRSKIVQITSRDKITIPAISLREISTGVRNFLASVTCKQRRPRQQIEC